MVRGEDVGREPMSVMRVASGPGGRTITDRPPGNSVAWSPERMG